jgi:lipoprotein-anchoring transpeptidase ErfK/SrfK
LSEVKQVFSWEPVTRWFAVAVTAAGLGFFAWWQVIPLGVGMVPTDGATEVDPREPVVIETIGLGSRLSEVQVQDNLGRPVASEGDERRLTLKPPLAFGTRYTIAARVEREWTQQVVSTVMHFETVAIPRLSGPTERVFKPDRSVTLQFDRPVGELSVLGDLAVAVEPAADRRSFRLAASNPTQGKRYPVQLVWSTTTGVPLPPLKLDLVAPPPLTVKANTRGLDNLGLALPLQLTFSEPLLERAQASNHIAVQTDKGEAIAGKWRWVGSRRLRFTPAGGWPAVSTIRVSVGADGLAAVGGGYLEKPFDFSFTTGTDRHIYIYLDTQKVAAVENGRVVRTFRVSTGKAGTPTVTGHFYIYDRYAIKTMRSRADPGEPGHYVVENVPYAQFFHEGYAFHGAWWHNAFGTRVSHGCVNMATRRFNKRSGASEDAGWLWKWAAMGVPVTVLAKTSARTAL